MMVILFRFVPLEDQIVVLILFFIALIAFVLLPRFDNNLVRQFCVLLGTLLLIVLLQPVQVSELFYLRSRWNVCYSSSYKIMDHFFFFKTVSRIASGVVIHIIKHKNIIENSRFHRGYHHSPTRNTLIIKVLSFCSPKSPATTKAGKPLS